jgi:hypothetical protein
MYRDKFIDKHIYKSMKNVNCVVGLNINLFLNIKYY